MRAKHFETVSQELHHNFIIARAEFFVSNWDSGRNNYNAIHDHELHGAELAKEGGACISIALAHATLGPCYIIVQCYIATGRGCTSMFPPFTEWDKRVGARRRCVEAYGVL